MIEFVWWWALLLLPFPILVRWIFRPVSNRGEASLYVPFYSAVIAPATTRHRDIALPDTKTMLLAGVWILLLLSVSRPVWLGESIALPSSGRDLMLAVDISGSMEEDDFDYQGHRLTRLQAVKTVAGEFVERRQGDRLGLILFGTRAYVQTPLTFDLKTVRHFLDEAVIGLAGQNTSVGDAIGLAIKRLRERPQNSRLLILLTDGSNTAGLISPAEAAQLAQQVNIRIHTIGVGAEPQAGGLFSFFANRSRPLDEKSLREIAETTGGKYFRARDIDELSEIYALIDQLEPTGAGAHHYRPLTELYPWPLAILCLPGGILCWRRRGL